ncbi:MAG: hypothetical protein R3C68_10490 [Myxococcota bacterium]
MPKGVIANNIVPVYNPAIPSRRWSAYEDLIVYVIKNNIDILCIDRHDKNDGKTRDEIMEATLDNYADSKGGWAKVRVFALMGSWHASTAIDKKMSAQGAASSDIDTKPLGYRLRKRFGDHLLTVASL